MQRLKTNYFWIFLVIATAIYACQAFDMAIPTWVNNYVNDFLCLPIVLHTGQTAVRYIRNDRSLDIPLPLIILMPLLYSIYFEWLLPKIDLRYTSDWIDVLLYFAGAFLFYFLNDRIPKSFRLS